MKKITKMFLLPLLASALMLISFAGCGGCATDKGQYNPSTGVYDTNAIGDTVVVTAENLRESALAVFLAFGKVEKENDAALRAINPKIHEAAETIRRSGQQYLDDLTAAKTAYQSARTQENANKLTSAMALVRTALISASKHLAEASTRKVTP
jgi:hypothetical protein